MVFFFFCKPVNIILRVVNLCLAVRFYSLLDTFCCLCIFHFRIYMYFVAFLMSRSIISEKYSIHNLHIYVFLYMITLYQPFPKWQILDASKLKEFADDNFKFDENDGMFSKRVENTVGKGEIARNEQFLFFPIVFSKDLYCRQVKTRACLGKG